jgi:hypothetical protein
MAVVAHFRDFVRNLLARPIVLSPDQSSSIVPFLETALRHLDSAAPGINIANEVRPGNVVLDRDFFRHLPESIFNADARSAASNSGGALDDQRFHRFVHYGFA